MQPEVANKYSGGARSFGGTPAESHDEPVREPVEEHPAP
jgi:hypothetical protein